MMIDLHTHSTASDGTTPPGRADARRPPRPGWTSWRSPTTTPPPAGRPPRRRCRPASPLVPGAELSCRWYGVEPAIPLHLLAYLFDPAHPALVAELARVRESRRERGPSGWSS